MIGIIFDLYLFLNITWLLIIIFEPSIFKSIFLLYYILYWCVLSNFYIPGNLHVNIQQTNVHFLCKNVYIDIVSQLISTCILIVPQQSFCIIFNSQCIYLHEEHLTFLLIVLFHIIWMYHSNFLLRGNFQLQTY